MTPYGAALSFPAGLWESIWPRYCAERWWDAGVAKMPKLYAALDRETFIRNEIEGGSSPWRMRVYLGDTRPVHTDEPETTFITHYDPA